jgi:hypothetical protein
VEGPVEPFNHSVGGGFVWTAPDLVDLGKFTDGTHQFTVKLFPLVTEEGVAHSMDEKHLVYQEVGHCFGRDSLQWAEKYVFGKHALDCEKKFMSIWFGCWEWASQIHRENFKFSARHQWT